MPCLYSLQWKIVPSINADSLEFENISKFTNLPFKLLPVLNVYGMFHYRSNDEDFVRDNFSLMNPPSL